MQKVFGFSFASLNRDLSAFPEYISNEGDFRKATEVYVTTGKSLDWIITIDYKRVFNSLFGHNKCLKAA